MTSELQDVQWSIKFLYDKIHVKFTFSFCITNINGFA